jgi:hypothetical protein
MKAAPLATKKNERTMEGMLAPCARRIEVDIPQSDDKASEWHNVPFVMED